MKACGGYVSSDDGTRLYRYEWFPKGAVRSAIHLTHGLGDHAGRYESLARDLTSAGHAVYAHDHRGHGRTAGRPECLGWFAPAGGWDRAVQDLVHLLHLERSAHPGLPLILFGHSMGSFMAQQVLYAYADLISGCVLSGSSGKPRPRVNLLRWLAWFERCRLGARGRSRLLHYFSLSTANKEFEPRRTDFDWLSRDPDQVDRYCADPYCGFVGTVQLWLDLLHGVRETNRPVNQAKIPPELPVYILAGTADPVSDGCAGLLQLVESYRRAGMKNVRWKFYEGGRHEMLNEINRDEVIADLLGWLDSVAVRGA
jgi:alpha-beta hydrolase superfamily lysophospholipase